LAAGVDVLVVDEEESDDFSVLPDPLGFDSVLLAPASADEEEVLLALLSVR
jgi:hypothetical protein